MMIDNYDNYNDVIKARKRILLNNSIENRKVHFELHHRSELLNHDSFEDSITLNGIGIDFLWEKDMINFSIKERNPWSQKILYAFIEMYILLFYCGETTIEDGFVLFYKDSVKDFNVETPPILKTDLGYEELRISLQVWDSYPFGLNKSEYSLIGFEEEISHDVLNLKNKLDKLLTYNNGMELITEASLLFRPENLNPLENTTMMDESNFVFNHCTEHLPLVRFVGTKRIKREIFSIFE